MWLTTYFSIFQCFSLVSMVQSRFYYTNRSTVTNMAWLNFLKLSIKNWCAYFWGYSQLSIATCNLQFFKQLLFLAWFLFNYHYSNSFFYDANYRGSLSYNYNDVLQSEIVMLVNHFAGYQNHLIYLSIFESSI